MNIIRPALITVLCRLLCICAVSAVASGNPTPDRAETPNGPGGAGASLKRLEEGSGGKTPTVKSFTLDWVRSLAERGEPRVYTREDSKDFEYIGMPVGGIGCGMVYLGGDGKL